MESIFDVALSFAMENKTLVDSLYHYLKAEGLVVFYAPAPECQIVLSGENQREIFYRIFGKESRYVVLVVSKDYVLKEVPMEEARIAFSKHNENGTVIPVYTDGTALPKELLDPSHVNYFKSNNAAEIASHVAAKIRNRDWNKDKNKEKSDVSNKMDIKDNIAGIQMFVQNYHGDRHQ